MDLELGDMEKKSTATIHFNGPHWQDGKIHWDIVGEVAEPINLSHPCLQ